MGEVVILIDLSRKSIFLINKKISGISKFLICENAIICALVNFILSVVIGNLKPGLLIGVEAFKISIVISSALLKPTISEKVIVSEVVSEVVEKVLASGVVALGVVVVSEVVSEVALGVVVSPIINLLNPKKLKINYSNDDIFIFHILLIYLFFSYIYFFHTFFLN